MEKKVILTGDRPTGPLHLGHFVGSLNNRVLLQDSDEYDPFIIIADVQALTDNAKNPEKVRKNVLEVTYDYLAVGIDPTKTTIFVQSMIPEIAELTVYFMNLVSMNRLMGNPTVKSEIKEKGFGETVPVGFVVYPISQAADILFVNGRLVPVGADQVPMIEQAREIARTFNETYGYVFHEPIELLSDVPRLPGITGPGKMGKSTGNAIFLSDSEDELHRKVMSMYTDPDHIRVEDPGKLEGNTVFTYLDTFDPEREVLAELKLAYQEGGVGDVLVKRRLFAVLNELLEPIRTRRALISKNPEIAINILKEGTAKARERAQETMKRVREVMKIDYF